MKNHDRQSEVWLVYYKKHTGKATIRYTESVEEALCFGWIDGLKKRIDEQRYAHRFTPRKRNSKWSALNIKLARKLIEEGKMTATGLTSFEQRKTYDGDFLASKDSAGLVMPAAIEKTLQKNNSAWKNFNALSPGYRKQYIAWLSSAKKPQTRERRLKEAIELLVENKKLGMK